MSNNILVSIIIANYDGERFINKCLHSIFKEKGRNFEVIVVDDASEDASLTNLRTLAHQYKNLRIINLTNHIGAAAARNIGVNNSKGKYLIFLDIDTEIKIGWYDELINFFSAYHKTGIVQFKLLKKGTNNYDYAGDYIGPFGFLIERSRGAVDKGQFNKIEKIFSVKSAGISIKKSVFLALGGFDEDFVVFYEDSDIAWRAWLLGYEVNFLPSIVVYHAYVTKGKDHNYYVKNKVIYRGCRNTINSLIKNLGLRKLLQILPVNLGSWLILSLVALIKLDFHKNTSIIRGVLWNILIINKTLKKRSIIQKFRKISDDQLFSMVGAKKEFKYYLGKGISYILGKPF